MIPRPPTSTLFPYTTLFRSAVAYGQSRRAATNVLKLDPKNTSALLTLGDIHRVYDWNWTAANQDFQQAAALAPGRSEEHTSELQSHSDLVCRLLLEKKKQQT